MTRLTRMFAVAFLSMLFAAAAPAATNTPNYGDARLRVIDDPLRTTFMGDPGKPTKQELRQAIGTAALAKDWKVLSESDGRTELNTTVSGKHLLHVQITYDSTGYTIQYIDSVNMLAQEIRERNRPVQLIHKNYNVWIRQLADTINKQIGQPARVAAATTRAPVQAKLAHNRVVPPATDFAAIDNVDAVPVREAGKDRYRHFLTLQAPKAFVVTEKGGWRMWFRNPDAMAVALDHCEQQTVGCWLYAVDDRVVWSADPGKRVARVNQLLKAAP